MLIGWVNILDRLKEAYRNRIYRLLILIEDVRVPKF